MTYYSTIHKTASGTAQVTAEWRDGRTTKGTVFRGKETGRLVCLSGKTLACLVITRPAAAGALANGSA